jgi:hypothetical protein
MIWHYRFACQTISTPLMPRRDPEDINLEEIQSDLEFIMERLPKLVRHGGQTVSVAH